MKNQCKLSENAQNYLCEFEMILDRMIEGMTGAKLNDSISHNFIVQMIPHHMAAIEMSENILKYTSDAVLQNIASGIISEQTKSIENMRSVQCLCNEVENSQQNLCAFRNEINSIMKKMFCRMKAAIGDNNINCDFLREMIPHHRGAVEMSKTTLKYDICPQLKPILNAITVSQCKGIEQMERLSRCLGCRKMC